MGNINIDAGALEATFGVHILAIWMTRKEYDDTELVAFYTHAFAQKARGAYVQIDSIDCLSAAIVKKLHKPDAFEIGCEKLGLWQRCWDIHPKQYICPCSRTTRQDRDWLECLSGASDLSRFVRVVESRDGFALAYFEDDESKPDTSRTYTYKDAAGTTIKMHFDGNEFVVDSIEEGAKE